ncbi:Metal-dependent hydrolase, endonuclease/exonuclease/phosphatase family [Micromonospora nigra]|uniref:Metal-dependent hydrolase, endonuclease/exonuclease/phosphatase family n=1 Tax=Micromonospora nigra TaxID=145857 RepID=A0A1C6SJX7_9ACTN|nr:endonuclease/exonuclease/phosphatase family protein [Micromonospora nigra]SCL29824.1 Metal-dependent hydrolase, endonuclease/exonuclease/phosphatase family [Micromonospora nigra]
MTVDPAPSPARRKPRWTVVAWLLVTPGVLWALVRFFDLDRGPLVQALAFTPYACGASLVPLLLAAVLRRRGPVLVAALTTIALAATVAPRALPSPAPEVDGPALRVLTANLLAGSADPALLVALVRAERVDVLAVQELTPQAATALDGLGLADLLPHRQTHPVEGTTGSGLYSRHPMTDGGIRHLRGAWGFTQAYATLAVAGSPPIRVESVHPAAPYAVDQVGHWRADLAAQPPATPRGPLSILAGDFNATLDHSPLRALIDTGYTDAAAAVGAGLVGTWGPYDGDLIPPVTIDHVLVDRRIAVRAVEVHGLARSDHRAVLADLRLPGR